MLNNIFAYIYYILYLIPVCVQHIGSGLVLALNACWILLAQKLYGVSPLGSQTLPKFSDCYC